MSIVEKMAMAISGAPFPSAKSMAKARAALTATGLTEAQLEGLAKGDLVIVSNPFLQWENFDAEGHRAMLAAKEG